MKRKTTLSAVALCIALVGLGSTASASAPSSTPSTSPVTGSFANQGHGTYVVYGIGTDGKAFRSQYTNAIPTTAADTIQAAASTICSVYVSDVSFDSDHDFEWTVEQICSGDYGSQYVNAEINRSSYTGWRQYGSIGKYPGSATTEDTVGANWSLGCDYGGGHYDYIGIGSGYSSFGSSGNVRSENTLKQEPCGTEP